jgi:nicotinamide mononucleotide transporter
MDILINIYSYIINSMSLIEIIATIVWLLSVYFTVKQNILCWPTWIIMVVLYIYIFYDAKLYSDAILQVIFLFMQFYWWYVWVYSWKEKNKLPVKLIKNKLRIYIVLWIIMASLAWWHFMNLKTDNTLPYWDAFILYISLTAQLLLSFKIIESWILWIVVDILSIFIYYYKSLYLTTWLYFIFLILAILWLIEWKNQLKKQNDWLSENSSHFINDINIW